MAIPRKIFRIQKKELQRAVLQGFDSELKMTQDTALHSIELQVIDSAEPACAWGRLSIQADLPENAVLTWYAYASDEGLIPRCQWQKVTGFGDGLLYEQSGRYLWLYIEISGNGEGRVREITVDTPGDPFLQTFPEIYRTHGSFFHRYLSIFSSVYLKLQDAIDRVDEWTHVDRAPYSVLTEMAGWLGIDVTACALSEDALRTLVKEAHELNSRKGTRWAVERIAAISLGREVKIVERCRLPEETGTEYDSLYGDSPYDFTILAPGRGSEEERDQLFSLLDQFIPARSRARLVFLRPCSRLDDYCYLNINSRLLKPSAGVLGREAALDEHHYMAQAAKRRGNES